MTLICCVDITGGMMFNQRRQTQDVVVIEDIRKYNQGKFFILDCSKDMFEGDSQRILDTFLNKEFDIDDVVFVESEAPSIVENDIDMLVIYNWNRQYPADLYFDIDLGNYKKIYEEELQGNSHDKIIKSVYKKALDR